MQIRDLDASQFARLSALLDEALNLAPPEREAWLASIARHDEESSVLLRRILAAPAGGADPWLETRDAIDKQLASLPREEQALAGRRFGPYRVISLLGHGGMGSVWLAERADGLFNRRVALKLLHPALVGRGVGERFAREREILAGLEHPNIARLLDAGIADDGQPYLALQYVNGVSITAYCDRHRRSIRERLQLFLQVLAAVQYAHAHLVIHRDLKPSNILVTEDGEAQLLDFGIAKLLRTEAGRETELTQLGGRALTPEYAAPEQIAGGTVTTAVDVYSLGVILYELLTGQRPYRLRRESRAALEEAVLTADPLEPSRAIFSPTAANARATTTGKLARSLKGDLDTITIKALEKAAHKRYATVNAFAEDLARFLRGDVVLARRDSFPYRAAKFVRRNRISLAVASVFSLTLAAGLATTTYEARVASAQRDRALEALSRLLAQAAAARLQDGDAPGAMRIILEVLSRQRPEAFAPEALSVFQEARASDSEVLAVTGHAARLNHAAFSPDGRSFVTAGDDGATRIWDSSTGRSLMVLSGHAERVWSAAFSTDGRRLATASADKSARIWDVATGRQLAILAGHAGVVQSAAFSPDGQRVVTGSGDATARIWDAVSGRQTVLLSGHSDSVSAVAFSPDARHVATASYDKTARVWDSTSGRQLRVLTGHTDRVRSIGFSPDGLRVITASNDRTVRVWDAATGREVGVLHGHTGRVASALFSPDGTRAVTASTDTTARIWDSETDQQLELLKGHRDLVESAVFSPDGRRVLTASHDRTARTWDAQPAGQMMVLHGHSDRVWSAAFSPDGKLIVSASEDKSARLWDAATGRPLRLLSGHSAALDFATFSPDGRSIVTVSDDKTGRIWDVATGRQTTSLGHADSVWSAGFSPDSRYVATASNDQTARIWDVATGEQTKVLKGHTDRVWTAFFSMDGRHVVTASDDKTARIWEVATGRQLRVLMGHADRVTFAQFSPDGLRVITASDDKTARIWDSTTGRVIHVLVGHTNRVWAASFSADGQRVVTASDDRTARIWDAAIGQQLAVLRGHTDYVETAMFSPDGQRIVTASDDRTVRVWDARIPSPTAQINWARAAQFDPLSGAERAQLGLPAPLGVRQWPPARTKCDESAAAPYDPDRRSGGVMVEQIVADVALAACSETNRSGHDPRSLYQHARALLARGRVSEARSELVEAVDRNYRAARVDLARVLSQPSSGESDIRRAVVLLGEAWGEGVTVAAVELGRLYENGVGGAPDSELAWSWYRRGADAAEPNALARLGAAADEAAATEENTERKAAHLLEAFRYYAAAAERARAEDWADEVWWAWRYRRASLARVLAGEGLIEQVAAAHAAVLEQYARREPSAAERLAALVGLQ